MTRQNNKSVKLEYQYCARMNLEIVDREIYLQLKMSSTGITRDLGYPK